MPKMPNYKGKNSKYLLVYPNQACTITDIADKNLNEFMQTQIGKNIQVLVESHNNARTPDDIPVHIDGAVVPERTICDIKITGISDGIFTAVKK